MANLQSYKSGVAFWYGPMKSWLGGSPLFWSTYTHTHDRLDKLHSALAEMQLKRYYVDRSRSTLFHSRDKLPILWLLFLHINAIQSVIYSPKMSMAHWHLESITISLLTTIIHCNRSQFNWAKLYPHRASSGSSSISGSGKVPLECIVSLQNWSQTHSQVSAQASKLQSCRCRWRSVWVYP